MRWNERVSAVTGQLDHALGALYGLAIGDALGMPTQLLSRRQIMERWGQDGVTGFEPAAPGDRKSVV